MIVLFITENCGSCKKIIKDIPSEWNEKILVLKLKYDWENLCYRAYDSLGNSVGDVAPVEKIPAICFFDTGEVYTGYSKIMDRLINGNG